MQGIHRNNTTNLIRYYHGIDNSNRTDNIMALSRETA